MWTSPSIRLVLERKKEKLLLLIYNKLTMRLLFFLYMWCSLGYLSDQTSMILLDGDSLSLSNGYINIIFNLTQGSLTSLKGRFLGDGVFDSSPNLCGPEDFDPIHRRGCLNVAVFSPTSQTNSSSSEYDRVTPLPYTILSNSTSSVSFSVALNDSLNLIQASLILSLDAGSRSARVEVMGIALAPTAAPLVSVEFLFAAPSALSHYARGIRQAMNLPAHQAFIASSSPIMRFYALGDGSTGCAEVLASPDNTPTPSYMFAGGGGGVTGGIAAALFGAPAPLDVYTGAFGGNASSSPLTPGVASPRLSFLLFPNDYSFPTSNTPLDLPPKVNVTDLRSILTAAHGNAAAPLHSYDFYPEVRATPCLTVNSIPCFGCGACYGSTYNYFDPDSVISTSAMLWSFDPLLHAQVSRIARTRTLPCLTPPHSLSPTFLCMYVPRLAPLAGKRPVGNEHGPRVR